MNVLVADDSKTSRMMLSHHLESWGYTVSLAENGIEAWREIIGKNRPPILMLDWEMPGYSGIQICNMVREHKDHNSLYIILVTSHSLKEDIITGFDAGADDYVVKPFDKLELKARIQAAARIVELQQAQQEKIRQLEEAQSQINELRQLLPICMHCHKIMDTQENWTRIEDYISKNTNFDLSHSICPDCLTEHYPDKD